MLSKEILEYLDEIAIYGEELKDLYAGLAEYREFDSSVTLENPIYIQYIEDIRKEEDQLYNAFCYDPSIVKNLLDRYRDLDSTKTSIHIPMYKKNILDDLEQAETSHRIFSRLQEFFFQSYQDLTTLFPKTNLDNYQISHILLEDPTLAQRFIQKEFKKIFLYLFNYSVEFNLSLKEMTPECFSILDLEYNYLFLNPEIEEELIRKPFLYEQKLVLDNEAKIQKFSIPPNCYSYFNEAFDKEQAMDAITNMLLSPIRDYDFALNSAYLQAAIIQARDPKTLQEIENYFNKYQQQTNFNPETFKFVSSIIEKKEEIREGFIYKKAGKI